MDLISASLRTALDKIYQRLLDYNFGLEVPELAMRTIALLNAMGREGCTFLFCELSHCCSTVEEGEDE